MAQARDTKGILLQNLQDARCGEGLTAQCMQLAEEGRSTALQRLLSEYKKELLEALHTHQRQLDCLDFLLFQLGVKSREDDK